jgi:hypothetical protein
MHPIFKVREKETPEIVELLSAVTLGTNGAHYRHLDTEERINESDNPLFLTMERNEKTIGNVTFCRRNGAWYIRYFAFSVQMQSSARKKSRSNKSNLLKRELNDFFQSTLDGKNDLGQTDSFYAYIDPNNEKSLWMSENFGFETVGHIATQTFSRVNPKVSTRIEKSDDWSEVSTLIERQFGEYQYYFTKQTDNPPFYLIRDENNEIIALAKTSISTWEIKRLPGKLGGFLTAVIPFVPRLRKIIRPKRHSFVVPEAVIVKDNSPKLLEELFSGILASEKKNLMLWWVDENDPLYCKVRKNAKWGILHKLVGVNKANVVQRTNQSSASNQPFYTAGFDFI